ncbi:hypothetical protein CYMTET_5385 [Cymbomonas tetramitiformis]|uniref:Uncharacterized protein n=1 Tax=Cymbomonas tetramitiformis TaxID=36881 RepID=A0AAE0GZK7_9CHLO|nr:hypothetical protein CYMTET_5385 [Cymbomonas tetramitiformis]
MGPLGCLVTPAMHIFRANRLSALESEFLAPVGWERTVSAAAKKFVEALEEVGGKHKVGGTFTGLVAGSYSMRQIRKADRPPGFTEHDYEIAAGGRVEGGVARRAGAGRSVTLMGGSASGPTLQTHGSAADAEVSSPERGRVGRMRTRTRATPSRTDTSGLAAEPAPKPSRSRATASAPAPAPAKRRSSRGAAVSNKRGTGKDGGSARDGGMAGAGDEETVMAGHGTPPSAGDGGAQGAVRMSDLMMLLKQQEEANAARLEQQQTAFQERLDRLMERMEVEKAVVASDCASPLPPVPKGQGLPELSSGSPLLGAGATPASESGLVGQQNEQQEQSVQQPQPQQQHVQQQQPQQQQPQPQQQFQQQPPQLQQQQPQFQQQQLQFQQQQPQLQPQLQQQQPQLQPQLQQQQPQLQPQLQQQQLQLQPQLQQQQPQLQQQQFQQLQFQQLQFQQPQQQFHQPFQQQQQPYQQQQMFQQQVFPQQQPQFLPQQPFQPQQLQLF